MNANDFKAMLAGASRDTQRLNPDAGNPLGTAKPERVARERVEKTPSSPVLDAGYRLCRVDVEFFAQHGKRLDPDNLRFVFKPGMDALIDLGFAITDAEIETHPTQRLHRSEIEV